MAENEEKIHDRESAYQLWAKKKGEIKLSSIAKKFKVTESTVRNWKWRYKWAERFEQESATKHPGAPKGNKNGKKPKPTLYGNTNALKHGAYSKLLMQHMSAEEASAYVDDEYADHALLALKTEIANVNVQQLRLQKRLKMQNEKLLTIEDSIDNEDDRDRRDLLFKLQIETMQQINITETALDRAIARKTNLIKILLENEQTEENVTVTFGDFTPQLPDHEGDEE